ncbi:hypothetical protein ADM96_37590 [Burkholderia sp. ST111]|nr:hypothetical protein ADM96_37590 [Burkholderia sp. ST111]
MQGELNTYGCARFAKYPYRRSQYVRAAALRPGAGDRTMAVARSAATAMAIGHNARFASN